MAGFRAISRLLSLQGFEPGTGDDAVDQDRSVRSDVFRERVRAAIWLKNGDSYIGQLMFHPEGQPLPPDGPDASNPSLHYRIGSFQHALDLLRNEGPVWLLYSGSGGGFENGLKTGSEFIGEGEPRLTRFPG